MIEGGEEKTLPTIKGKVIEPTIEPQPRETYTIKKIDEVVTEKNKYGALRVELEPTKRAKSDTDIYVTMLWKADTIPSNSKLGAFIDAFNVFLKDDNAGYDTDNWLNKTIRFIRWESRDREIEVV